MSPRPRPTPIPLHLAHEGVLPTVGLDRTDVRSWIRAGQATRIGHGVLLLGGGEPTVRQRVIAASLTTGAPSSPTLLTAAVLLGWRDPWPSEPVHLLLPHGDTRHQRRPGVRLHFWDLGPGETTGTHPLLLPTAERAAYDICRRLSRNEAVATMDAALHRRRLDPDVLRQIGERLPKTRRQWLTLVDSRSESWLESIVRLVLHDHGLHPELQHEVRQGGRLIARLDLAFVRQRLAIECDGDDIHSAPLALFRDRHRADDVTHLGWRIIRVTTQDVLGDPAGFVRRVRRALAVAA